MSITPAEISWETKTVCLQQEKNGVWNMFNEVFVKLDCKPNTWEERQVLFVGYLIKQKRKSSTIKSYISTIKSVLLTNGIKPGQDTYLLTSLTKACRLKSDRIRKGYTLHCGHQKHIGMMLNHKLSKFAGIQAEDLATMRLNSIALMTFWENIYRSDLSHACMHSE